MKSAYRDTQRFGLRVLRALGSLKGREHTFEGNNKDIVVGEMKYPRTYTLHPFVYYLVPQADGLKEKTVSKPAILGAPTVGIVVCGGLY